MSTNFRQKPTTEQNPLRNKNLPLRVSVVIPALNEADNIAKAIHSAWSAGAAEVLVVDGGSQDDTQQIAGQHASAVLESRQGRAAQQNLGAQQSTGDVLLFLHADNHLAESCIEQLLKAIAEANAVCGAFRNRIEASGLLFRCIERGNTLRASLLQMPYGDQGIFVRRDAFDRVGGYPEVQLMEDFLLMKSLRKLSRPVLLAGPIYINARRWQQHGILRQTVRNWMLVLAATCGVSPNWLSRFYPSHAKG